MTVTNGASKACRVVLAHPEIFDERRFGIEALRQAAGRAEVLYRGWPFIFGHDLRVEGARIEAAEEHGLTGEYQLSERWELHQSGLLIHRATLIEDGEAEAQAQGRVLDIVETLYHVGEAIGSIWRLYGTLAVPEDEAVTVRVRYTDLGGRRLTNAWKKSRGVGIRPEPTIAADIVEASRSLPLWRWRVYDAELASEIATDLFKQMGWTEPNVESIRKTVFEFLGKRQSVAL